MPTDFLQHLSKTHMRAWLSFIAFGLLISAGAQANTNHISIATGPLTGSYHIAGKSICSLVNKERKQFNLRCHESYTRGGIFNINALLHGETDFAIIKSDLQAQIESGNFERHKIPEGMDHLRSVLTLYEEPFTVIVRADSKARHFSDIRHKNINLAYKYSATYSSFKSFITSLGWDIDRDFGIISELNGSDQIKALCGNELDALVLITAHPNSMISALAKRCDIRLLPIVGPKTSKFLQANPWFKATKIDTSHYAQRIDSVPSIAVQAVLITRDNVPDATVYSVVKSVLENLDYLHMFDPSFESLTYNTMHQKVKAPYSTGALKYYNEQ